MFPRTICLSSLLSLLIMTQTPHFHAPSHGNRWNAGSTVITAIGFDWSISFPMIDFHRLRTPPSYPRPQIWSTLRRRAGYTCELCKTNGWYISPSQLVVTCTYLLSGDTGRSKSNRSSSIRETSASTFKSKTRIATRLQNRTVAIQKFRHNRGQKKQRSR